MSVKIEVMKAVILTLLLSLGLSVAGQPRTVTVEVTDKKGGTIKKETVLVFVNDGGEIVPTEGNRTAKVTVEGEQDVINIVIGKTIFEIPAAGMDSVNIVWEGKKAIRSRGVKQGAEVFETGYGTVPVKHNANAMAALDMSEMRGYRDLASYIEGCLAGVRIENHKGTNYVFVRGRQPDLTGSGKVIGYAKIIVDGVESPGFDHTNRTINMQDIKSVTVIKDGAVYGHANGVLVITTKRGGE